MPLTRRQLIGSGVGLGALAAGAVAASLLSDGSGGSGRLRESAVAKGTRFPGDPGPGRLFYGASVMPGLSVPDLETSLDHRLTLRRSYFDATEVDDLVRRVSEDHAAARLPVVSTKLPGTWAQVASGAYDTWLLDLLDRLVALTRPVLLSLHHEPENNRDEGPGMGPADWVGVQQRAIGVTAGTSITILPILTAWTFLPQNQLDPGEWWVPGAAVMGIDCYNPWSTSTSAPWVDFADRMAPVRAFAGDMPLLVAEYGCRTPADDPSRAAAWMVDAFEYATLNDIAGLAYFDSSVNSPDGSWVLDDVRTQAMRECIGQAQVVQLV